MNQLNTLSSTTTKMTNHLNAIAKTCDALIAVLDMTTEKAAQYGGGIVQGFDSEFVDVVIKLLLQLRMYTKRLGKEVANGLIRTPEDLALMVEGMQDFSDQLNTLMHKDARLRNNFEFALREIDQEIKAILDMIEIN